ncbi:amino acid adenylation domain-containing protein [Streptacidiphilus sp. EB129]|uniref:non-ribosomal peptide synthetase n=1 Tax=Streptacidiphilus sp. EB129 TaxID=3156262 RepID=UPI0035166D51
MSTGEIEMTAVSAEMTAASGEELRAQQLREELLRQRLAGRRGPARAGIPTVDRSSPLPLSFGQQQLWFLDRLDPASPEYLVPLLRRLRGPLDTAALHTAWEALLARHEILRTRYRLEGTEPVQVVDALRAVEVPVVDLTDLPENQREDRAIEVGAELAAEPFDLAEQWPVRMTLLRLGAEDHILVVVFHHIACDAWSTQVFEQDLGALYGAFAEGRPSPLPELAVQYADFAAWQRQRIAGPELERRLGYWREQLSGSVATELPTARPRPPVRDWRGSAVPLEVPAEVTAGLRELCRAQGVTPFMALLAAFNAILSRYTGRDDIAVGTVVSERTRPELQRMIGYGINSLVMRGRWEGEPTFAELLADARSTTLGAFDHQEVPFARLVDELSPERDTSRTPLFQVAFTLHESAAGALDLPGLRSEVVELPWSIAKFDLALQIEETPGGGLRGQVEFAVGLFDRVWVEGFAGAFVRLLEGLVRDPGVRVSRVGLLSAAELALVAAGAEVGTAVDGAVAGGVLHGVFEGRVVVDSGAVAVVAGGVELSYGELNGRANRLARYLGSLGVGVESLVGVCLERGGDLVPSLLGVLKAGGAYVPLDPAHPVDRWGFVLGDTGARVVVTTSGFVDRLAGVFDGVLVVLDRDGEVIDGLDGSDVGVSVGSEALAYVIYTSGSTGRPKGVCVSHGNVLRLLGVTAREYGFGPGDVWPLFHSYAFDVSVWELWGALAHGGRLVVVPVEVARAPDEFLDLLVEHGVTVLNQTPSAFRALVGAAGAGDPRVDRLRLRAVVFAGERLDFPDLAPWIGRLGLDAPRLVNMYGITETTVHSTYHRVVDGDLGAGGNPVGRPLGDLTIRLLDRFGELVPVGVPGEIFVGGPGVTRGYLGRPGLTAERFVPDPFGGVGERLYRSGDLARRNADGTLDFLGRIDDQVKIRGYRIELGEVQAQLAAHASVRDAVVVVREDSPGDRRLVAYVTGVPGQLPDAVTLRSHLSSVLPSYMVPAAFVVLEGLPLTANGKLDRRALPAPGSADQRAGRAYTAPRNPAEEQLADIWTQVLGHTTPIGIHDNFFDLGGDSIRAVVLVGALRAAGFDVSVRDVFEFRTVAELAASVAGRGAAVAERPVERFALLSAEDRGRLPEGVSDAYPMSQVQLGMLVEMLADEELNSYHNITLFRIRDDRPFHADSLREAARLITARHEMLRTSFAVTGYSVPMQLVHEQAELPVDVRDLRALPEEEQQQALRDYNAAERANVFDTTRAPLLRISAHLIDEGSWWFGLTECHSILEGWSFHSLLMEVLAAYRTLRDGSEPEQPAVPAVRYADFIAAELRALDSAEDRGYWQDVVRRHATFALPAAWAGDPAQPRVPYRVRIPYQDLDQGLRALASAAGVSLKSVLHSAHLKVMSMVTDEPAFFTGLVCNARPEVEGADRVYGMYLNSLPFGYDRSARTWRELVRQTFAREVELWPHRRFPMPVIQRGEGEGNRLLDVRFSYLDFHQVDTDLVDFQASIDDSLTEFSLATLVIGGHVVLNTDTHALTREHADRLAGMYRAVLEAMVADPDGDARAEYLPAGERETLLERWSSCAPATANVVGVLQAFEEWAARTPDADAVTFGAQRLSYARLDERANRLAQHLSAAGAGPESIVGVLLDRGPELVVSLLALWKAGAAYLPIDPEQPAPRVSRMLAAAGARILVSTAGHAERIRADDSGAARYDGAHVLLDRDAAAIAARPATPLGVPADPDRLAYVIYTSGSTGVPKGVQVPHRGLANHVGWAAVELAGRGTGGAALFSSVAFDLVVPNLWAPLVTGQRLHVLEQDFAVENLGELLLAAGPFSFVKLTPGHLEIIGHQLDDERAERLAEVLVVAGEGFPVRSADRWLRILGPGRLINEYGPTEASVGSTILPVDQPQQGEIVPIGRPLPGMTAYVLDRGLRPVPVGVPGELYVGGTGVARGYAGQPVLTAERFVPDLYGAPGARLYRTGDLARMLPGGVVDFLGRIDDQVKIRGHRIELGEIQAVLAEHPGIRDVTVVTRVSASGDPRLLAYHVPSGEPAVSGAELAAHCAARLPAYMVPSAFTALDRLPLNRNGKIDRRALPAPDEASFTAGREYLAPRSPLEELIATAWSQVLDADRIGVHDNFFDLGGHSIRAVVLVGALRAAGLDVTVRDVFEHRTVAELAASVAGRGAAVAERPVERFALLSAEDRGSLPEGVSDAYPMSQVQLGMLVEMLADDELNSYHNITLFRIRDDRPFHADSLREAVRLVTGRHEILRTSFAVTGYSVPMQLVHERADIPVDVRDLRALSEQDREQAVRDYADAERADVFDTTRAPLMRVGALVEDDSVWRLTFTQCHSVTEGWTFHTLVMEVLAAYRALRDGDRPEQPPVPAVRYADFIAAELRALDSAEDRGYWHDLVQRYTAFAFPSDWADTSGPREDYQVYVAHQDLEPGLRALASAAGVSLKSVLHSAHLKVMSMVTDEPAFFTGLVYSARPELEGADKVYGMQLNSLPFPHDRGARTWRDLVRQTFAREVEQWQHRRFPMPVIQREAGGGRRLIDVLFTFQDFDQMDTELVDTMASEGDDSTEFALGVPTTPGYYCLRTHTHALAREHADRLAGMYRAVLEAMAADADGDARAEYLPAGERESLLADRNAAAPLPVAADSAHQAFEAWAARTPDAVAVSFGAQRLSYAEVNERANRLAHHLRDAGAGPETTVGVLLEPGIDLVPTLLGVLKSGAAYLPLDLAQPANRLEYMLADAGHPMVVTRTEHAAVAAGARAVVTLDGDAAALAARPGSNPEPLAGPDNAMYVIYTSGSSGRPKGVTLTHGNLLRLYPATARGHAFDSTQVWALLHSYAFDVSVWEMWGALLYGGSIAVVPPSVARNPEELLDLLTEQRVTTLAMSPVAFRALITAADGDRARIGALSLRHVVFGGDRLDASDLAEWTSLHGLEGTALAQAYGPTETTVHVTFRPIGARDLADGGAIPLGGPVDDTRVYVLDAAGRLTPAGVPGELYVGGAGLARGYAHRPALTAERFLPDPYGPPGARMYRTGDLARVRPGSERRELEFLGRVDEQLKIRGYRIEPGEIQAVLLEHPGVREAVVVARDAGPDGGRLVAYLVTEGEGAPSPAELSAHCAERLPGYMVPAAFVALPSIPLTVNGKLDHRALPAPDRDSTWSERPYLAPRGGIESTLAEIWSGVLGVEKVGIADSFFELGGDSISVLRVMAAAREAGLPFTLRMLYQSGTIELLAVALAEQVQAGQVQAGQAGVEAAAPESGQASAQSSGTAGARRAGPATLPEIMAKHQVPGASVALLRGGELVAIEAYGVVGAGSTVPVTPDTPFKVASISKHITALGALTLAAQGRLDLDEDVNAYLGSWRIPEGAGPVTVRQLLANVSGLALEPAHDPYLPGDPVPGTADALHGRPPARTPAVGFEHAPGRVFRKNKLNYLVLEQVLADLTGEPFAELMRELVLLPLGMVRSCYDWAHHERSRRPVALGHDQAGRPVPVGLPIHPSVAGGGLWTTAGDLARAAVEIRRAYLGLDAELIDQPLAQAMLTPHQDTLYGLSTVVDNTGDDLEFGAFGEFDGYWAMSLTRVRDGDGIVVLTNSDSGREVGRAAIELLQGGSAVLGRRW